MKGWHDLTYMFEGSQRPCSEDTLVGTGVGRGEAGRPVRELLQDNRDSANFQLRVTAGAVGRCRQRLEERPQDFW